MLGADANCRALSRHTDQQGYRQTARQLLVALEGDSQWTGGVEGPEVGRQHVFSAVEPVEWGRRDAPWSQRAAGKTTSRSLLV